MDHKREHRTPPFARVMGVGRQQQHYMDSETLSDSEDNQESVAEEVCRTRSGRPSKPPDRYTSSKALLVAVFGKDYVDGFYT